MKIEINEQDKKLIMQSLDLVGKSKSIGYLPKNTLENLLEIDENYIKNYCKERDLSYIILSKNQTFVKSGAVYLWSEKLLNKDISMNSTILLNCGIELDTLSVIKKISKQWYDSNSEIYKFIKIVFGDLY